MDTTNRMVVRGVILGRQQPSDIVIRNGSVAEIRDIDRRRPGVGSKHTIIAPTLFDIQVNGYAGINLQGDRVSPDDVGNISDLMAARGVALWVPTLITGAQQDMEHGCRVLAEAMNDPRVSAAIPGIHIEGPYISPMDGPRGAHAKAHVRKPSIREFDRLLEAAHGKILYTTVAPEVDGAIPYIRGVVKRGVKVSLGHHHANADQIARAVDAGATLCTHLGNGMAPQIQRHFNPIWPQLAHDGLACSFIADLEHLPVPVLKTFIRAKGPDRSILTSDVVHIAGLKPGRYELGGVPVELTRSGRICLTGSELLAGSSLMLLQGVLNAAEVTDLTLEQAFASATTVPARILGVKRKFGPPRVGAAADFIAFDINPSKGGPQTRIRAVYINGIRRV